MGSLAYIALVLALAVGIYLLIRYQRERQKELYRYGSAARQPPL